MKLGRYYFQKEKNYDLAKENFDASLKIKADFIPAIQGLINAEKELGNLEEAFALSEEAIKKFPLQANLHLQHANLYLNLHKNDDEKTLKYLKRETLI